MTAPLRILVVEDHTLVASSLRRLLESHGYQVHVLTSLEKMIPIEEAVMFDPQVVIVDRFVGGVDAWEWAAGVWGETIASVHIIKTTGDDRSAEPNVFIKGKDSKILLAMVVAVKTYGICVHLDCLRAGTTQSGLCFRHSEANGKRGVAYRKRESSKL